MNDTTHPVDPPGLRCDPSCDGEDHSLCVPAWTEVNPYTGTEVTSRDANEKESNLAKPPLGQGQPAGLGCME